MIRLTGESSCNHIHGITGNTYNLGVLRDDLATAGRSKRIYAFPRRCIRPGSPAMYYVNAINTHIDGIGVDMGSGRTFT